MKKNSKMKLGAALLAISMGGGSLLVNSFAEGSTKENALDGIYALKNLSIAEKINLDKKINEAKDDEIKQILDMAIRVDSGKEFIKTKKEDSLEKAKKEAKKEIDKLEHLDNKPGFKTQIDVAKSVEEINPIVEDAKVVNQLDLVEKTKEELGKENLAKKEALSKAKDEAKKEIDKLEHLDNKPGFKTQIDVAKSVKEINEIVEEAKEKDASNLVEKTKEELGKENALKQAKAKAKKEIDKLGLSKEDTAAMYKQIDEAETIAEVEQIVNLAKLAEKTKKDLGKENSSKKDNDLNINDIVDNDNKKPSDNDLNINDIVNDDDKKPSDDNKKPSDDNKKPSDDNKKPSDDNKKPSDDNKKPSKTDKKVSKNNNVAKKVDNKKNVKTGVAGIGGVLTTLFAATGAYFASKKNK